jgi:hypothetical protein
MKILFQPRRRIISFCTTSENSQSAVEKLPGCLLNVHNRNIGNPFFWGIEVKSDSKDPHPIPAILLMGPSENCRILSTELPTRACS